MKCPNPRDGDGPRRWVVQDQYSGIYHNLQGFTVCEHIAINPELACPSVTLVILPADQSHKEQTGDSPNPCRCSSYWFPPPNHHQPTLQVSLANQPSIKNSASLAFYETRQSAAQLFFSEAGSSSSDPTYPMDRLGTAPNLYWKFISENGPKVSYN